jgi:ubiquinone biosynthesis O-methyltransferase
MLSLRRVISNYRTIRSSFVLSKRDFSQTVDALEVNKFRRLAEDWWNPAGEMKPLHEMNPLRVSYIRSLICKHFRLDPSHPTPLKGLHLIDVGCGGGMLSESLSRIGGNVLGIDAAKESIEVAKSHAAKDPLLSGLQYEHTTIEEMERTKQKFDVVCSLEVIEHVADLDKFIGSCRNVLKPNGLMFLSTLNRTLESYVFAIVGAEHVMKLLAKGTHDWNKFIKPQELVSVLNSKGLDVVDIKGMVLNPVGLKWELSPNIRINYILCAKSEYELKQ